MSTFILPPGFAHIAWHIRNSNTSHTDVLTFAAEVEAPPFLQSDAVDLYADLAGAFAPLLDSAHAFVRLVVLVGQDGDAARFAVDGASAGTRAAVTEGPPQVSYLWSKQTNLSGRRNRGRVYVPGVAESSVDEAGRVLAAELTIQNTGATAVTTALSAAGGNNLDGPVLLHSQAPSTPTPIVAMTCSPVVATQRRRLIRTN